MVSTKLMYFLLPVFLFVGICDSLECPDANTAVLADFDLKNKFSPDDIYQLVGWMVLNSTNPDATGSSGVTITTLDQCNNLKYKFETDANANTWNMVQQTNGPGGENRQVKFDNLPQAYGDFVNNPPSANVVSHARFLTQSVEPWQIISICSEIRDLKLIPNTDLNLVHFFLNTKTPVEANTFSDKLDEVIRENKFQATGATNFCPKV